MSLTIYLCAFDPQACIKTCYQKELIKRCGCADPQIPFTGIAFGDTEGLLACDSANIEQGKIKEKEGART